VRAAANAPRSIAYAVVEGIGRTGRLVTSAALILGPARVLRVRPSLVQPEEV
jgi:hypothetical protein